tara:strand:+ start:635 stop:889 length:255 start_codon:yes stop_codon:yes gene_type:complete
MAAKIKLCKPISPEHQRANRWFSSLIHQADFSAPSNEKTQAGLEHCIDFFRAYAQTGDKRFLNLCEDFLQYTLTSTKDVRPRAA